MKKLLATLIISALGMGCAYESGEIEEEEAIGINQSEIYTENSIEPNGLIGNGLVVNGIVRNGIVRNGIVRNGIVRNGIVRNGIVRNGIISNTTMPTDVVSALAADTSDGQLARILMKYIISCALPGGQSIVFDWTDSQSQLHEETYYGALGLAPDYGKDAATELPVGQQEWLSACIAARTNYYGVSVTISMRGDTGPLTTDESEQTAFNKQEGAFWGNLFADPPTLKSCHNTSNLAHSRTRLRECAAGHDESGNISACGPIVRAGDCSSVCTGSPTADGAFTNCDSGKTRVITTFLN